MKHACVGFILLLSSLTLAAQNPAKTESPIVVDHGTLAGNECPIGMAASQGVWDHTVRVRQGQKQRAIQPYGQRIFLTLNDSRPDPIVAATVKVHGLTGKSHMAQTDSVANAHGEATRTMEIAFATSQSGGVTGDLYIPGFTAVNSIELIQVSYDDGKIWRIGASNVCRVTPDPMMLIANH